MSGMVTAFQWENGGIWMYLILLVSVVCLGLIIERIIVLFIKSNINARHFMMRVQQLVLGDQIDKAIQQCNSRPGSALSVVVKAGLTRADRSELEIQNAIEEASLEVVPKLLKRMPLMAALANIATLLGLLGTIIGLISAFEALESATPDKRQEMLARGISIAMNTTAFGLMVAIPTLIAHSFLSAKCRSLIDDIELYSTKIGNILGSRK